MKRFLILGKLAHACFLYPHLRVGQILSNAVEGHSASNVRGDLYYLDDDLLLHTLREYNKEAL